MNSHAFSCFAFARRGRAWSRSHVEDSALVGVLCVGVLLRLVLTLSYTSAFTGYSDSGIYMQDSVISLWSDPIRTVGYSMFLRILHAISPHILTVVIVQHALGLGAATLLYFALARAGAPRWLGLIPAAALALFGDELLIEHSALSEPLFIFLLALMLFAAASAVTARDRLRACSWSVFAGVCAGLCVWDRAAALAGILVLALWLLFSAGRPGRREIALALIALATSAAVVGIYVEWRDLASGHSGLTTNGAWNLYGRVAPWADCNDFVPPTGTRVLCESTPVSARGWRSSEYYIYGPDSPAIAAFGPVYEYPANPQTPALLEHFAEAAVLGQPLAYLRAVGLDTERLIDPNRPSYGDLSASAFYAFLLREPVGANSANTFVGYWQTHLYPHDHAITTPHVGAFITWERITRLDWGLMIVLILACLIWPWTLPRGRVRALAGLCALLSLELLLAPIFTKAYDYRFVIPALGPLAATAALAYWGLWNKIRARRAFNGELAETKHQQSLQTADPSSGVRASAMESSRNRR